MIYGFIRAMLGTSGDAILDFYITNSLWINALILLYAVMVVLARYSYNLCQQLLISSIQNRYGPQFERKKASAILKVLQGNPVPWEQALRTSPFPFVTPPGSLRIYPKNLKTLQTLLPVERLAELVNEPRSSESN